MSHKVLLLNRSYGRTVSTVSVCGHSGHRYGYSLYSEKHNCHTIEMSLEEYEKAADDLARGWHKAMCKWIPHFIEVEDEPSNVVTQEAHPGLREMITNLASKLTDDDIRRIAKERGIILTAVPIEQPTRTAAGDREMVGQPVDIHRRTDAPAAYVDPIGSRKLVIEEKSCELPTKYLSLCQIARQEGVDISGLPRKADAVREAILAKRQQKAA